jgi:AraC-like DNA-binding protein
MVSVAGMLGLSRQALYRQLRAEGATFQEVLDDLRHRMAIYYVSGRKVSVNEAAFLVGFSDPAAFSRAFKRWTGVSPRAMKTAPEAHSSRFGARSCSH